MIAVALCGVPPGPAERLTAWLTSQPGLDLAVTVTAPSTDSLLEQLAVQPAHAVVIDGTLGLEGLSFAQELLAAGYRAVCLTGVFGRPLVRQRAAEAGLATLPDHEPARLAGLIRRLMGLEEGVTTGSQIIAFHSPRGGAGTSSLALQAAFSLAAGGAGVALVEVSGGGGLVPLLGLRTGASPRQPGGRPASQAAAGWQRAGGWGELVDAAPGLQVVPSGGPTVMDQVGPDEVEALIHGLPGAGCHYILIDTAAELTLPTAAALALADHVCLIALPEPVSAFRLVGCHDVLAGLGVTPERIHPVLNRSREQVPPRLQEVLDFLRLRPPLRVPDEPRPPLDGSGRFTGWKPGSGAAKAVDTLLQQLTQQEVTPP